MSAVKTVAAGEVFYGNTLLEDGMVSERKPFKCACGKVWTARIYDVSKHRIKSCGCRAVQTLYIRNKEMAGLDPKTDDISKMPEYRAYCGMKSRCYNPKMPAYANYGGRGITICNKWLGKGGFMRFIGDMGRRPPGFTIERINYNKGYSPDNCKWIIASEQARNTRNNAVLTYGKTTMIQEDWIKYCKISRGSLYNYRKKHGDDAIKQFHTKLLNLQQPDPLQCRQYLLLSQAEAGLLQTS